MVEPKIEVPSAPVLHLSLAQMPESAKDQWRKTYAEGIKQARIDAPEDPGAHNQAALKEANRMLRISEPTSYKEAAAMEDWTLTAREERSGNLVVKTIDGKRYSFPIPSPAQVAKAAAPATSLIPPVVK